MATQIPLLIKEQNGCIVLRGHIMTDRSPQSIYAEPQALVVFYWSACFHVSASWYKLIRNKALTWNYMSVHGEEMYVSGRRCIAGNTARETTACLRTIMNSITGGKLPVEYVQRLVYCCH